MTPRELDDLESVVASLLERRLDALLDARLGEKLDALLDRKLGAWARKMGLTALAAAITFAGGFALMQQRIDTAERDIAEIQADRKATIDEYRKFREGVVGDLREIKTLLKDGRP